LLIAYAIMRHQLLDIQVVIRKGLLYSIPTVLIGAGYFMIITLALRLVHISTGIEIFMLSLVVAVLTAILAQPLRDRMQEVIDRLFFREKYDTGRMLQRLSSAVASVLDLEKITGMILEEVTKTMHIEKGGFLLKRAESAEYELAAQRGLGERGEVKFNGSHPVVQWLGGKGERGGILRRQEIETLPQFRALWGKEKEELEEIAGELYIPVKAQGELVGIFVVGAKRSGQGYSMDDEYTLATLANQTAIAIENARWYQEAKRLAMTDALTSLSNRRRLYELGEAEIQRARQTKQPLMIMMFDVDNFKRTNDQFGHAVGDQVLQMVSRRYLTALRGVDLFARYGGDEFVIIPDGTGDDEAIQLAQRLCGLIKKEPVTTDAGILTVTISMGLTGYVSVNSRGEAMASPSLAFDKLLHQADMAMYTAKREGGDRVCVFPLIIDEGIK
jgi:diguanylate cyclase (GGDEF)-like protein